MWSTVTSASHATQVAPRRPDIVPSSDAVGGRSGARPIENSTRLPLGSPGSATTVGTTQASLPFFLPSHHDRTRGISMPQPGLGQRTVRAQIQAITAALVPSGSVARG